MKRKDEFIEIDIWKLVLACIKRFWIIFLVAVLCGAGSFALTKAFVAPKYQSTVKLYVNNSDINVGNISISASDLTASIKLVDVYEVILNTKDTLDKVIKKASLDLDYEELSKMIATSSVNDTQVFKVTVTSTSPEQAQLIASTIGQVLPNVISGVIESADARIVEHASMPKHKSSPSYSKNAILGAFIGIFITVLIICISELLDNKIKGEEDILEITGMPILTYIPDFEGTKKSASYSYKNRYYYSSSGKRGKGND